MGHDWRFKVKKKQKTLSNKIKASESRDIFFALSVPSWWIQRSEVGCGFQMGCNMLKGMYRGQSTLYVDDVSQKDTKGRLKRVQEASWGTFRSFDMSWAAEEHMNRLESCGISNYKCHHSFLFNFLWIASATHASNRPEKEKLLHLGCRGSLADLRPVLQRFAHRRNVLRPFVFCPKAHPGASR